MGTGREVEGNWERSRWELEEKGIGTRKEGGRYRERWTSEQ